MATTLQSYVIGFDQISSEDIYNLQEDSGTVIGGAEISFVEVVDIENELFRVVGSDEIFAMQDSEFLDADGVVGLATITSLNIAGFYSEVVGTAVIASLNITDPLEAFLPNINDVKAGDVPGDPSAYVPGNALGSIVEGEMHRIGASLPLEELGQFSSTGIGIPLTFKEDFIDPDNPEAFLVIGYAQLPDIAPGKFEKFNGFDVGIATGAAEILTPQEGAIKQIISEIFGRSESGSPATGSTFALDSSPLDDPAMTLDAKFVLNTDTVDGGTYQVDPPGGARYQFFPNLLTLNDSGLVIGTTEILASVQHFGEVIGIAEILDEQSEGYSTGEPYNNNGYAIGGAVVSATSSVIQIAGTSNGSTLVTEGLYQLIKNAPEPSTEPDIALRYSISAIEEYTFVPALAGYSLGISSTISNITIDYAISAESDGVSVVVGRSLDPGSLYDGGGDPPGYYGPLGVTTPTGPTGPTGPGEYT